MLCGVYRVPLRCAATCIANDRKAHGTKTVLWLHCYGLKVFLSHGSHSSPSSRLELLGWMMAILTLESMALIQRKPFSPKRSWPRGLVRHPNSRTGESRARRCFGINREQAEGQGPVPDSN